MLHHITDENYGFLWQSKKKYINIDAAVDNVRGYALSHVLMVVSDDKTCKNLH